MPETRTDPAAVTPTERSGAGVTWYPDPDPGPLVAALTARFAEEFGAEPDGVWAAPGRVNLIGEHVDYNGGLCLPAALAHRTFVAVRRRTDGLVRVRSLQDPATWEGASADIVPGGVPGWAGYAVGVPWGLVEEGLAAADTIAGGFDALVDGRVPLGAGLSSSAALECAVAVALDDLFGLGLGADDAGRARLAAACVAAERKIAGAPTGGLDQAASLRSRPGHALLIDCRDFSVDHLRLDLGDLDVLIIDTRAHHVLTDGQYGSAREACERAAAALGVPLLGDLTPAELPAALAALEAAGHGPELLDRVTHVVTEIARVAAAADALRGGRYADLGALFDASHASLRDDFRVSCAELDVACAAATGAGALGARMTGGGFGGSAIALVRADEADRVAAAVAAAFAAEGFAPPLFLRMGTAVPAGRVPLTPTPPSPPPPPS